MSSSANECGQLLLLVAVELYEKLRLKSKFGFWKSRTVWRTVFSTHVTTVYDKISLQDSSNVRHLLIKSIYKLKCVPRSLSIRCKVIIKLLKSYCPYHIATRHLCTSPAMPNTFYEKEYPGWQSNIVLVALCCAPSGYQNTPNRNIRCLAHELKLIYSTRRMCHAH